MPRQIRFKTDYPGIYFVKGSSHITGKPERIYYMRYLREGIYVEEKAGRQYQDKMTPAKAAAMRTLKIRGDKPTNEEKRQIRKNKPTINYLWETYKLSKPHLKGLKYDENRYKNHLKEQFGKKGPNEIKPLCIDKFRNQLLTDHSPATVKNILELLRRIINFGAAKKLSENIDFKIELPKLNNQKTEDLSGGQLDKLIKAIDEDHDIQVANFMRMALFTGMRRGELFRIKWDHINFDRGFIKIVAPKGGKDQEIPLNDATRELLLKHPKKNSEYVFPGKDGKQRVDIKKAVNRIKKKAELPKDFRPLHGLRHVYASMLASSGQVDMYTLQKLLTHKSPQMTQRYAHLRDETLKKASNLAGKIILKVSKESK